MGGGWDTYVFLEDVSVDKLVFLHIFKMVIVFLHETALHLREFIIWSVCVRVCVCVCVCVCEGMSILNHNENRII